MVRLPMRVITILLILVSPFVALDISAAADSVDMLNPSSFEVGQYECILLSTEDAVCYVGKDRSIWHLDLRGKVAVVKRLVTIPEVFLVPPDPQHGQVGILKRPKDFSAQLDRQGNILVAWIFGTSYHDEINLLRLQRNGQASHYVVKSFQKWDRAFDLKVVDDGAAGTYFFYINYGEKYFSPISDAGDMAKLWALRWQDGEVLQDKQINEKGKFEVKQYSVLPEDKGVFDVAWIEKSRRVFSSHRETLEITKLASANNSYQLKKIGSARVKEDPSWVEAPIFFPNIFASSEKTFYVLLYANVRFRHTLVQRFESSGKLLASTVVKSDVGEIDEFGFDPHTGLYRYVDGGLNSLSGPKRLVESKRSINHVLPLSFSP